jgi:hypothetical protein
MLKVTMITHPNNKNQSPELPFPMVFGAKQLFKQEMLFSSWG